MKMTEIIDIGDGKTLGMEKAPQIPWWQDIHNRTTDDLKEERHVKHVLRKTIAEINEIIKSGKWICDDCGALYDRKLPVTYQELHDFVLLIINNGCYSVCDNCHLKSIKNGSIIGCEDEWFPSKEKLLEKFRKTCGHYYVYDANPTGSSAFAKCKKCEDVVWLNKVDYYKVNLTDNHVEF